MGESHDTWQEAVRQKLRPWRDRLVHGLGGTMPQPAPRSVTYDQLVELLYPTLPAELRPDVDHAATGDLARA
jgi:hypothetical protein